MDGPDDWSLFSTGSRSLGPHSLVCVGAGEQSGPVHPYRNRTLPSFGIVYVSSGSGQYSQPRPFRVEKHVEAPALISIIPGVEHGYGPDDSGWTEHWMLFSGSGTQLYRDLGLLDPSSPVMQFSARPGGVPGMFAELRDALSNLGLRWSIEASIAAQRILLTLAASPRRGTAGPADAVLGELERTATLELSMADRARSLRMSLPELRELVRTSTGMSLLNYIVETKLSRAQALLAGTALPVGEVSRRVGYGDPAYFSRLFTRRVGVAPSVFRKQQSRLSDPGIGI